MSTVHIFVSFDLEHDADLCSLIVEQSADPSLGFEVSGRSQTSPRNDPEGAGVRRRIREADQVIVICGEQTEASKSVIAELQIAQEENKPYFLLWGRRDRMCTKPAGAKTTEGMYSWTLPILQDQITNTTRNADWESRASEMKRPARPAPEPAV